MSAITMNHNHFDFFIKFEKLDRDECEYVNDYYYAFNSNNNSNSNYHLYEEIQNLKMFKMYIDPCFSKNINFQDKRFIILLHYPQLVDRVFTFWCLQNNLEYAKYISSNFMKNETRVTLGETIDCKQLLINLIVSLKNTPEYFKILSWIIQENILPRIDYLEIIKEFIIQNQSANLIYLLDLLILYNPFIIYQEKYTLSQNITFQDMFHWIFDFVLDNNSQMAIILRIYRPYQYYYTTISSLRQKVSTKIQYHLIKERNDYVPEDCEISFREELMRNRFHPKYADKWVDWGHNESDDFE